jgi:hypothetical protein
MRQRVCVDRTCRPVSSGPMAVDRSGRHNACSSSMAVDGSERFSADCRPFQLPSRCFSMAVRPARGCQSAC